MFSSQIKPHRRFCERWAWHLQNSSGSAPLFWLDDIIIISQLADERVAHVRQFLMLLYETSVTLDFKKCELYINHTEYHRHGNECGHLELLPTTMIGIGRLQNRIYVTELRPFEGSCSVFCHFMPNPAAKNLETIGWRTIKRFGNAENEMIGTLWAGSCMDSNRLHSGQWHTRLAVGMCSFAKIGWWYQHTSFILVLLPYQSGVGPKYCPLDFLAVVWPDFWGKPLNCVD